LLTILSAHPDPEVSALASVAVCVLTRPAGLPRELHDQLDRRSPYVVTAIINLLVSSPLAPGVLSSELMPELKRVMLRNGATAVGVVPPPAPPVGNDIVYYDPFASSRRLMPVTAAHGADLLVLAAGTNAIPAASELLDGLDQILKVDRNAAVLLPRRSHG